MITKSFFRNEPKALEESTRAVGQVQESKAALYFKNLGWKLLRRNYRCRLGEIDLIFKDGESRIIFVEVKFRSSGQYGEGQRSVGTQKQRRMAKIALVYIKENRLQGLNFRFDVAAVSPGKIEHIQNAFSPGGYTI